MTQPAASPVPSPPTRPAGPATRSVEEQLRRRRFRRFASCVGACVGVGVGAGVVHTVLMGLATMRFSGGGGGAVFQLIVVAVFGAFGGVVLGLLFAAPFTAIAYRRTLSGACSWMMTACAGVSLVAMILSGFIASSLQGSQPSSPDLWLLFLAVLVFASPLLGMGLGLLFVAKCVPATWTPFPPGCCQFCGYDRRGLNNDHPCPECGTMLAAEASA